MILKEPSEVQAFAGLRMFFCLFSSLSESHCAQSVFKCTVVLTYLPVVPGSAIPNMGPPGGMGGPGGMGVPGGMGTRGPKPGESVCGGEV